MNRPGYGRNGFHFSAEGSVEHLVGIGVAELLGDERDNLPLVDGLESVHLLCLRGVDENDAGGRGRRRRHLGWRLGRGSSDDAEGSAGRRGREEQAAAGGGGGGCDGEAGARGGEGHSRGCHWSVRGGLSSRTKRALLYAMDEEDG
jgi:hypothetical protein